MAKEVLSWEKFDYACAEICAWSKQFEFNSVYGFPRGGLALAVKLSHLMGVPMIMSKDDITPKTLIVDDIADTGKTLNELKARGNKIATLYYHKQSAVIPDKWFFEKTDEWIIFPWEAKD